MADILIRGMEMPKYTTKAEFGIDADGNPLCMVYHENETEPDIYDVVLLPEKHGRLGDMDALEEKFRAEALLHTSIGDLNRMTLGGGEVIDRIKAAPTIIEAEGGGEDG